jgi:hypothetical protein
MRRGDCLESIVLILGKICIYSLPYGVVRAAMSQHIRLVEDGTRTSYNEHAVTMQGESECVPSPAAIYKDLVDVDCQ